MALFQNRTRNQHFISQAEQSLNAIDSRNPSRIFSFTLENRDRFAVALERIDGISIRKKSLRFNDLFSFAIVGGQRQNLEDCFGRYERNVAAHTTTLLREVGTYGNIKIFPELVTSKFLNLIRNPYSARKVLNILGDRLESFIPSEGEVGNAYRELSMPKPHYAAACEEFGLTLDDYIKWLQAVFLMINADFDGRPMIDKTIENILKTSIGRARIYRYSDTDSESVCLLSDRGLNDLSPNAVPGPGLIWDFNLTSKAFIRIWLKTFTTLGEIDRGGRCGWVELDVEYDNLDRLANYNQNAVYQCAQKVYCSGQAPYGIVVER